MVDDMISLKCRKCGSVWLIITLKGGNDFEYVLACPYCGATGMYDIEEVEDISSYLNLIISTLNEKIVEGVIKFDRKSL